MDMMQGYCFLRAVPMRREPSDKAEMVNQLLEGDTFRILVSEEKWSYVRCDYDGYEGWVDNKQWRQVPEGGSAAVSVGLAADVSPSEVAESQYLDAPYLWGGRTEVGIDCSGLTQVCFKRCGIRLLRDASQQATQGHAVSYAERRKDDLCFFQNDQGRIVHVGIYMGNGHIIHASGQVRVDVLDEYGIVSAETVGTDALRYTHRLHSIRRMQGEKLVCRKKIVSLHPQNSTKKADDRHRKATERRPPCT